MKRVKAMANRWRRQHNLGGTIGLKDTLKFNAFRPATKNLSLEDNMSNKKSNSYRRMMKANK